MPLVSSLCNLSLTEGIERPTASPISLRLVLPFSWRILSILISKSSIIKNLSVLGNTCRWVQIYKTEMNKARKSCNWGELFFFNDAVRGKGDGGDLNLGKKVKVFLRVVLPFMVEVILHSHVL